MELSVDNAENREHFNFIKNENAQFKATPHRRYSYIMKFNEKFLKTICQSDVFMYANLLPKIPIKEAIRDKYKNFVPIED